MGSACHTYFHSFPRASTSFWDNCLANFTGKDYGESYRTVISDTRGIHLLIGNGCVLQVERNDVYGKGDASSEFFSILNRPYEAINWFERNAIITAFSTQSKTIGKRFWNFGAEICRVTHIRKIFIRPTCWFDVSLIIQRTVQFIGLSKLYFCWWGVLFRQQKWFCFVQVWRENQTESSIIDSSRESDCS